MDCLPKQFFGGHNNPGATFSFDGNLTTWTYKLGTQILTYNDGHRDSRQAPIWQPMTMAGKMNAELQRMGSSYDGINKALITVDGQINQEVLNANLRNSGGKSAAEVSTYISAANAQEWGDNHLSLVYNMMRYVVLKSAAESGGSLNCSLGTLTDGALTVNMDQYWGNGYPAVAPFTRWPTQPIVPVGGDDYDFTAITTAREPYSIQQSAAIDVRGLTTTEATFVMIMMCPWRRSSRAKLDHNLPRLTNSVEVRGHDIEMMYRDWALGTRDVPMLSAQAAWKALKGYVAVNNLYEDFSSALYLVAASMYQFVPETIEAVPWLDMNWQIVLPVFESVRGRAVFFNTGTPAHLNQRPIDEWAYVANKLEKVNLIGLTFGQAIYTGLATRSVRRSIEMDPEDVFTSEHLFVKVEVKVSAAASEFTRISLPLVGKVGPYLTCDRTFDEPDDDRWVVTTTPSTTDGLPASHAYRRGPGAATRMDWVQEDPREWADGVRGRSEAIAKVARIKRGFEAESAFQRDYEGTPEQQAAAVDCTLVWREVADGGEVWHVHAPIMTYPGYPTFLTPAKPFNYPSIYDEAGSIDPRHGTLERRGFRVNPREGWRYVNFLNMCGYDATYEVRGKAVGPLKFTVGRHSNMVFPVLYEPDYSDDPIILKGQTMRPGGMELLPPLHNINFQRHDFSYHYSVRRLGVASGRDTNMADITDVGGRDRPWKVDATLTVKRDDATIQATGWITRTAQDFHFAPTATVGVVASRPGPSHASAAANLNLDGGSRPLTGGSTNASGSSTAPPPQPDVQAP